MEGGLLDLSHHLDSKSFIFNLFFAVDGGGGKARHPRKSEADLPTSKRLLFLSHRNVFPFVVGFSSFFNDRKRALSLLS